MVKRRGDAVQEQANDLFSQGKMLVLEEQPTRQDPRTNARSSWVNEPTVSPGEAIERSSAPKSRWWQSLPSSPLRDRRAPRGLFPEPVGPKRRREGAGTIDVRNGVSKGTEEKGAATWFQQIRASRWEHNGKRSRWLSFRL
jgi:hypothetical protein